MRVLPDIESVLDHHAEEAAFCWLLRDTAVRAPHYVLDELAELDERLEANIDGMRTVGEPGWKVCQEALGWQGAGEVFAAAVLAFESNDEERVDKVLAVGSQSVALSRGVVSTLGWLRWEQAEPHVQRLMNSNEAMQRRMGVGAWAVQRKDPGRLLNDVLEQDDVLVLARALRMAGELGRRDVLRPISEKYEHEDEDCRYWAAHAAMLLGNRRKCQGMLQEVAEAGREKSELAADLVARGMKLEEALKWHRKLEQEEKLLRIAVKSAGAIGDPVLMPWIIEMMREPALARVAGEAFSMLTGVDIEYEDLESQRPEGFQTGPTDDPEDENVDMDPDDNLPWPQPERIGQWWLANKRRFSTGKRYLQGKPMTPKNLNDVLRNGRQRQRAAAALELVLQKPGQSLFEVRARGDRQRVALGI